MKVNKIKIIGFGVVLSAIFAITNCGEKAAYDAITPVTDGARVRFLHAVQGGPPIVVYANNKKWSAVLNSFANGPDTIVYGGLFPANDYAVLPAGATNFEVKTANFANPPATAVMSSSITLENNKYYTVIAADTLPSPRLVTISDDRLVVKSERKTYIRFVNLLTGGSATGYEFVLRRQGVLNTLSTPKYGETGAVIELDPYFTTNTSNDSLFVRVPGTTTNLTAINLNGSTTTTLTANRLRTFILRGRPSNFGVSTIINN